MGTDLTPKYKLDDPRSNHKLDLEKPGVKLVEIKVDRRTYQVEYQELHRLLNRGYTEKYIAQYLRQRGREKRETALALSRPEQSEPQPATTVKTLKSHADSNASIVAGYRAVLQDVAKEHNFDLSTVDETEMSLYDTRLAELDNESHLHIASALIMLRVTKAFGLTQINEKRAESITLRLIELMARSLNYKKQLEKGIFSDYQLDDIAKASRAADEVGEMASNFVMEDPSAVKALRNDLDSDNETWQKHLKAFLNYSTLIPQARKSGDTYLMAKENASTVFEAERELLKATLSYSLPEFDSDQQEEAIAPIRLYLETRAGLNGYADIVLYYKYLKSLLEIIKRNDAKDSLISKYTKAFFEVKRDFYKTKINLEDVLSASPQEYAGFLKRTKLPEGLKIDFKAACAFFLADFDDHLSS